MCRSVHGRVFRGPVRRGTVTVMDWRIFGSTFAAIFLAEIGDKTQLATLSLATGSGSRWAVFAGSALALVATSAVAVLAGEALARVVSPSVLRRVAGVAFVVLGGWFLLAPGTQVPKVDPPGSSSPR